MDTSFLLQEPEIVAQNSNRISAAQISTKRPCLTSSLQGEEHVAELLALETNPRVVSERGGRQKGGWVLRGQSPTGLQWRGRLHGR